MVEISRYAMCLLKIKSKLLANIEFHLFDLNIEIRHEYCCEKGIDCVRCTEAIGSSLVWWPVDSPHNRPVIGKALPYDDVIMVYAQPLWPNNVDRSHRRNMRNSKIVIVLILTNSLQMCNKLLYAFKRNLLFLYRQCQKLRKNTHTSDAILLLSFMVVSGFYRSFIPNKTTFTSYSLTKCIWNPLAKAVHGKFHGSGGFSKCKCTQLSQFSQVSGMANCSNF